MEVLTTLIFILLLLNQVLTQKFNIELNLEYQVQPKTLILNVSVLNSQLNFSDDFKIEFDEKLLQCLQSDAGFFTSNKTSKIRPVRINKIRTDRGQLVNYHYYDIILKTEGYVRCHIKEGSKMIKSNIEFFRFNNFVYVVKLNLIESQSQIDIARNIQTLINSASYTTSMKMNDSVHITAIENSLISVKSDFRVLNRLRQVINEKVSNTYEVTDILSTRFCPSRNEGDFIKLPSTISGEIAVSETNYTFDNDDLLSVKCLGDFYQGVYWDEEKIEKILNSTPKLIPVTSPLIDIFDITSPLDTLYEIQTFADKLSNLKNFTTRELPSLTRRIDNLLSKGPELLQRLRDDVNTSNHILVALDQALIETSGVEGFEQSVQSNFAARVEDVRVTLGLGIAVIDADTTEIELVPLTINSTRQDVIELTPRAAIRLPSGILTEVDNSLDRLALSVFTNGQIFSNLSTSCIVSATFGGKHLKNLKDPVKIWFRRNLTTQPKAGVCVTWDFSLDNGRGNWSTQGCVLHEEHHLNPSIVLDECWCWHLTHFGELFWDHDLIAISDYLPEHSDVLDFITKIGCVISLTSLMGVVATAILAPEWIKGSGEKLKLQISISFALLLIIFIILSQVTITSNIVRVIMGLLLHYSMLSNFSWMLLAAFLQYSRLVKIVKSRSNRLPLKTGLIGWILPLLPPITLIISGHYYVYTEPPLYIPRGIFFYISIALPLSIVMFCNVIVFILIARNLYVNIAIRRHKTYCLSLRRFKQLVFLFMVLGLSWIFAIGQLISPTPWSLIFSYLFCISISVQGFTYLLFFVLMDESAKNAWRLRFCPKHAKYDVKRYTRQSKFVSMSINTDSGPEKSPKTNR